MAKTQNLLQLDSFKAWRFGNYKITQYRWFMFIISRESKDIWQTKTLRGALKWARSHHKTSNK